MGADPLWKLEAVVMIRRLSRLMGVVLCLMVVVVALISVAMSGPVSVVPEDLSKKALGAGSVRVIAQLRAVTKPE